jgi:hypothetical protein
MAYGGEVVSFKQGSCLARHLFFNKPIQTLHMYGVGRFGHKTWGGQTNAYIGSLFDDCSPTSEEPVYKLFRPNHETFTTTIGLWNWIPLL